MSTSELSVGREEPPASLSLVPVLCCLCEADDAEPLAVGEDFEYRTSADIFRAVRCRRCGLVYLDPRPAQAELPRIYPPEYHAFDFSPEKYGVVFRVRRRLEARRLLSAGRGLPPDARVLDVGCGDGFHLRLLRDFGPSGWRLEGVDPDPAAVAAAKRAGLPVRRGFVQDLGEDGCYDLVLLIQTIEHVDDPPGVLSAIRRVLRPGGRVLVVTDNVDSPDFRIFRGRHWGGYHFPRHFHLFSPATLRALAAKVGLGVEALGTIVSPVNWTYSLRNLLVDYGAPAWLYERFSLRSPVTLSAFTMLDTLHQLAGRGALLRAVLRRSP